MHSGRSGTGLSPYLILTGLCSSRMFLYLSLQSYPALIPILQKEWQMSLSGPWLMFKLRAMPESLKMAGGKR